MFVLLFLFDTGRKSTSLRLSLPSSHVLAVICVLAKISMALQLKRRPRSLLQNPKRRIISVNSLPPRLATVRGAKLKVKNPIIRWDNTDLCNVWLPITISCRKFWVASTQQRLRASMDTSQRESIMTSRVRWISWGRHTSKSSRHEGQLMWIEFLSKSDYKSLS